MISLHNKIYFRIGFDKEFGYSQSIHTPVWKVILSILRFQMHFHFDDLDMVFGFQQNHPCWTNIQEILFTVLKNWTTTFFLHWEEILWALWSFIDLSETCEKITKWTDEQFSVLQILSFEKTRDLAQLVEKQLYLQKNPSQFLTIPLCIIDGFLRDLVRGYCYEGY